MHIVLDFDSTITANDTIGHLGAAAVSFQTERQRQSRTGGTGGTGVDWDARWRKIVDDYVADHQRHTASYTPAEPDRTTLEQELAYLSSLRDVDAGSIRALHDAGLFRGMAPHHLAQASQAAAQTAAQTAALAGGRDGVRVRPGFASFLAGTAARRRWPVSIVSVNWSDAWIRGVVATQATGDAVNAINILTNEISDAGLIASNFARADAADRRRPVSSCLDKLEALHVAAARAAETSAHVGIDEPLVYMGDSTTDLACLIHAAQGASGGGGGGGIVLADGDGPATSKLLRALARLGYSVPHVSDAGAGRFRERAGTGTGTGTGTADAPRLAWARDFDEIMASRVLDDA